MAVDQTNSVGRRLALGPNGALIANRIEITRPCVGATITVSAEGATTANTRDITIQLTNAEGLPIDYVETFEIIMFGNAARTAFVTTGGSTGLGTGTDGALLAVVAKKYFLATSESDGDWDGVYLDTGTDTTFLGLRLPNGLIIMASELTNA